MDDGIDTGDIVAQQNVQQKFSDTGKSLHKRLQDAQVELFQQVWPDIESDTVSGTKQDKNAGTTHRTTEFNELCELDPDQEVQIKEFLDRLRALTYPPYDNATIEIDGESYYVDIDIRKA